MKTKLTLNARNGREIELPDERILCNDVTLPHDRFNPHSVRLWVIGNEYGPLCAVWASHEQDAFDAACDAGLLAGLAIEEADADEDAARLGNASEPHDLTNAWLQTVRLSGPDDWELVARFAEARGEGAETLER